MLEVKEIVDKYYVREKSGAYHNGKNKTFCFCGNVFDGDDKCPNCNKKDTVRISSNNTQGRRTDVVKTEDSLTIRNLRLSLSVSADKLSAREILGGYIQVDGFDVSDNLDGSTPKTYLKEAVEALEDFIPSIKGVFGIEDLKSYRYRTTIRTHLQIERIYPSLKRYLNQNLDLTRIISCFKDENIEKYDSDEDLEDILGIHESLLKHYYTYTSSDLKKISKSLSEEDVISALEYIEDHSGILRYHRSEISALIVISEFKEYGFDSVADVLEVSEKSQRYFSQIFPEVAKEYYEMYKTQGIEYKFNPRKPITNKAFGKMKIIRRLSDTIKTDYSTGDKILDKIQSNPMKGLQELIKLENSEK